MNGHEDYVLLASLVGTVITTVAMLWKTSHDQRHQERMFTLEREAERQERVSIAAALEQRTAAEAHAVRAKVETTAINVAAASRRDLAWQTTELRKHIDDARDTAIGQAAVAYTEANNVNVKLAKLHDAYERQARVIEGLLLALQRGERVDLGAATERADQGGTS